MYYLNISRGADLFREATGYTCFVDKSLLIEELYDYSRNVNKYIAITKPRRFGKTMAANMLAAFFSRGQVSDDIFDRLAIANSEKMRPLRNSFHVIHIDFLSDLDGVGSFSRFIERIQKKLIRDLDTEFPELTVTEEDNLPSILSATGEQFIFILDEWDAVFEMRFMTEEDREDYILFLRNLFKNQPYVHFVMMTGILPIAKYSSGSPLNMFSEFNAFARIGFEQYFGFTQEEIRRLVDQRRQLQPSRAVPSLEEIRLWYDGYVRRSDGGHMFNPDSVSNALEEGQCRNFWKGTGSMNDISNLISENAYEVRDDILRMVAGEKIEIRLDGFGAEERVPKTRRDILSSMVVYGFLTYHDGRLSIPNLELAQKFSDLLDRGTLGVSMSLEESRKLLDSTLSGREKEVAAAIEKVHDEQIPFIVYSDENSLACVIMYAYYAASDWYDIQREEKSGKGYVDFLFIPVDRRRIPIILELKYNRSARAAIAQIRSRNYIQRMKDYPEVLFVGINYSTRTKKHTCLIQRTSYEAERVLAQQK